MRSAECGVVNYTSSPHFAIRDFVELSKPRIVGLVLVTAAAGFYLAAPRGVDVMLLVHLLVGTALVAAGTNALNQVLECDTDRLMRRTARRPLPTGRVSLAAANVFAWTAGVTGVAYLAAFLNLTTAVIAAATLLSYVFVYTPLKRITSLNTLVGCVPGALPILGGWTAAGRPLGIEAWVLFWILFLWQLPHFLALAWLYREDYARAGLRMLSVGDADGRSTFRHAALYAMVLLPVSLTPTVVGISGPWYFFGAVLLSSWLLRVGIRAARERSNAVARRLFLTSVWYLPVLLGLMVANKVA
ncbi:MAG: protoheme IX farnesyltransferase [Gemmatimonadetes bacterium]|nr:protoheme IX farnesyltransferase [Gemmatimonadota bacterium]